MNATKDTQSVLKVKTLEKALYTQYSIDRQNEYLLWLEKLNEMDYNRRSRAFFAHLKSKRENLKILVLFLIKMVFFRQPWKEV